VNNTSANNSSFFFSSRVHSLYRAILNNMYIFVFIAIVFFFAFASPNYIFLSPSNLTALLKLFPEFGIVVLGVGILLIAGEIDLSVPSTIAFSAYILALLLQNNVPGILAIFVVLAFGTFIGFINGIITTKLKIPSFLTTLSMMMLLRGILYTVSGMFTIGLRDLLLKDLFLVRFFVGELFSIPVQFLWFSAFAVIFGFLLHFHVFGSWVYATGGNKDAARAVGINTDRVKTICFMIVGLLSAFSAIIQVARMGQFSVVLGNFYEFQSIAACVIGGVSIFGGRGNIAGICLGAFTIPMFQTGIVLMGVPPTGITAFLGLMIAAFAILNIYTHLRLSRLTK